MHPTRVSVLVGTAVAAGAAVYAIVAGVYTSLPLLPRYAPVTLFVLGAVEGGLAVPLRRRIRDRNQPRRYDPLLVARFVALAKASSLVGAFALGVYGAFAAYTFPRRGATQPHNDLVTSLLGVAVAALLVVGALALEHACRVPPRDEPRDADVPGQRVGDG